MKRSGDYKMMLGMQALYPNFILTNKEAMIYKQTPSQATTWIVIGIDYPKRHEDEKQRVERLFKEQNIRENGFEFLGERDYGPERSSLFHVKMGGGKIHQIRNVLKQCERSLILTHRQTLAADIYHIVLDPLKPQWYLVRDLKRSSIDFPTQETKATMGAANRLICQHESVHFLEGAARYTHLIIDESQLLFIQAATSCLGDKETVRKMWRVLSYLIRTARYVRFFDGFMGRLSNDIIKGLDRPQAAIVHVPPRTHGNGRTVNIVTVPKNAELHEFLMSWAYDIGKQVKEG